MTHLFLGIWIPRISCNKSVDIGGGARQGSHIAYFALSNALLLITEGRGLTKAIIPVLLGVIYTINTRALWTLLYAISRVRGGDTLRVQPCDKNGRRQCHINQTGQHCRVMPQHNQRLKPGDDILSLLANRARGHIVSSALVTTSTILSHTSSSFRSFFLNPKKRLPQFQHRLH